MSGSNMSSVEKLKCWVSMETSVSDFVPLAIYLSKCSLFSEFEKTCRAYLVTFIPQSDFIVLIKGTGCVWANDKITINNKIWKWKDDRKTQIIGQTKSGWGDAKQTSWKPERMRCLRATTIKMSIRWHTIWGKRKGSFLSGSQWHFWYKSVLFLFPVPSPDQLKIF